MKKLFAFTLALLSFSIFGFSQSHPAIKITNAFYTVSSRGAQMADAAGNGVDNFVISRYMVVEAIKGKALIIKDIKIDGNEYKVSNVEMLPSTYKVGTTPKDNRPVTVSTAAAGMQLWKVSFKPKEGKDISQPIKEFKIKGSLGGETFKLEYPEDMEINSNELSY